MHRLMHVTHISSVLVQKVSVFGSSRTSKVFHLTAEKHRDVRTYPRTQPTTSTCTYMYVRTETHFTAEITNTYHPEDSALDV